MIRNPLPLLLMIAALAAAPGCQPDAAPQKTGNAGAVAPSQPEPTPAPAPAARPIDQQAVTALAQEVARLRTELADVHAELDEARVAPTDEPDRVSVPKLETESELVVPLDASDDMDPAPLPGEYVALPLGDDGAQVEDVVLPPVVDRGIAASRYLYDDGDDARAREQYDEERAQTEVVNERVVEREVIVERQTEVEYPTVVREQVVYETEVVYQYVPFRHTHYIGCGHHYYGCSCHSWYYALPHRVSYHLSPYDYDLWWGHGYGRHHGYAYGHGGRGWGVSVYGAHIGFSYYDYDDDRHHGHRDGYTAHHVNRARRNGYNRGYRDGVRDGIDVGGTTIVNNGGTTVVNTRSRPGLETPSRPLDGDRTRRGGTPTSRSLARTDASRTRTPVAERPVDSRTRSPRGRETLANPNAAGAPAVAPVRSARPTAQQRADISASGDRPQARTGPTVAPSRTPVVGRAGRTPARNTSPRLADSSDATPGPSVARARARGARSTTSTPREPVVGQPRVAAPTTRRTTPPANPAVSRSAPRTTQRPVRSPATARPTVARTQPGVRRAPTRQTRTPQTRTPQTRTPQTRTPQTRTPQTRTPRTRTPQTRTQQTRTPRATAPQRRAPLTRAAPQAAPRRAPSVQRARPAVRRAPAPQARRQAPAVRRAPPAARRQPARSAQPARRAPQAQRNAPRRSPDGRRRQRDMD